LRAWKLAAVAALSVGLTLGSGFSPGEANAQAVNDSCPAIQLGAEIGSMCRQFSIFGLRLTPKIVRIKVNAPKGTAPNVFPSGTTVRILWRNGDRYAHQLQSVIARDVEGNLMGIRNGETGITDCTGAQVCFDYNGSQQNSRTLPAPGVKRPPGPISDAALLPRPGTYVFRCVIHPSMTQTIVVSNVPKFR
jgi:hypothetical protein